MNLKESAIRTWKVLLSPHYKCPTQSTNRAWLCCFFSIICLKGKEIGVHFVLPCYYTTNAALWGIVILKLRIFGYYIQHFHCSIIYGPTPVQCSKNNSKKDRNLGVSLILHRDQYQGCLCWPLTVISHVALFLICDHNITQVCRIKVEKKNTPSPRRDLHKYP